MNAQTPAAASWLQADCLWSAAIEATQVDRGIVPAPNQALETLCNSLNELASELHFLGKQRIRNSLMQSLQWRLRLAEAIAGHPEIRQQSIARPILICGPFRSGTTYLHRLMAEDAGFRWVHPWQSLYAPRSPSLRTEVCELQSSDPRIDILRRDLHNLYRRHPKLRQLHPVDVDKAEECFGFLESSALSPSFMFHAPMSDYLDWLASIDEAGWTDAYQRYGNHLRLLAWQEPDDRRWLLKSPVHLWNLSAFRVVFPDALVVYTHREPLEAVLSLCRLLFAHYKVAQHQVDPVQVGRIAMQFYRSALPRVVACRRTETEAAGIDVQLTDLRRHPVAVVRAVYDAAGLTLSEQTTRRIEVRLGDKEGSHTGEGDAGADAFGLDGDLIRALFSEYDGFHPATFTSSQSKGAVT